MAAEKKPKTEKKPESARSGRIVRCPPGVLDLIEMVREQLAERGDMAYWRGASGAIKHGSIADAPLNVVIEYCLRCVYEQLSPDVEDFAAAAAARVAYVESFEEPQDEEEDE